MKDDFQHHTVALSAPVTASETITPNDGADLAFATRAIYVGTTGDLVVEMLSGQTATLKNAQAGVLYPLRVKRVLATGTSATNIVGMR